MKTFGLKYPPIKTKLPHPFPVHVIYHQSTGRHEITGEIVDRFVMFSTKKRENPYLAVMECMKSTVDRDGQRDVPSVYVKNLLSPHSGLGFGTDFLNFVQVYSKKHGCNGYFHLFASSGYSPNRIPHIFYRKYGMNTECATTNILLDKFIAKGKTADHYDFSDIDMFYPPIKKPTTPWQKILMFFGIEVK